VLAGGRAGRQHPGTHTRSRRAAPSPPLPAFVASQYLLTRTDVTQVNLSQNGRQKGRNGRRTERVVTPVPGERLLPGAQLVRDHVVGAEQRAATAPGRGRCVSTFLDENRRCIGKSQSEGRSGRRTGSGRSRRARRRPPPPPPPPRRRGRPSPAPLPASVASQYFLTRTDVT
jgi:hypothetical protein